MNNFGVHLHAPFCKLDHGLAYQTELLITLQKDLMWFALSPIFDGRSEPSVF
jgi:hypothetical protein